MNLELLIERWPFALHPTSLLVRTTRTSTVYFLSIYTRRFAPQAAYAARYACLGRENSVKRTKVHD